jgi:arylsulfatase A-like enzyme/Tfp pilus assembly protein PilF
MRTLVALATIAATAACGPGPSRSGSTARPDILLVTIDTLRADRLGAGVTPTLDRLAATGLRFTAARSAVPLTLPSHTTMLTGLLPPAHGVRENGADALDERHPTIAGLLKENGYRTAAVVGAFVLDRRFGLARGFDDYDDRIPRDPNATERLEAERRASVVIDRAIAWLDSSASASARTADERATARQANNQQPAAASQQPATSNQQPFFLWVHLYDPHAPYNPPAEFVRSSRSSASGGAHATDDRRAMSVQALYDGEVAYADSELARLFAWLRDRGRLARTLVVVAGDHGEGLGDHGEQTHGMLVYDSTLRVPLIIVGPGVASGVRDTAVSLADIAPSILHAAGIAPPSPMQGSDLIAKVGAKTADRDRADLYAETRYPLVAGWSPLGALTDGRWKAIRAGASTELYDLGSDPRETHDLASAQQATASAMAARIDAIGAHGGATPARAISSDAQERLRALGYVAGTTQPTASAHAPNPASVIAAWNLFENALSALNAGRPEAATMLARLAADHPDAPIFQTTYARALKDAGRLDTALDVYRRSAARWPTDATLLHDLAVAARDAALAAHGDRAAALQLEAVKADQAALAIAPSSAVAHNGLGLLAADQDRHAEAAREFEQATALDPTNAAYWTNLGNARRATGAAADAGAAYRHALELDSRSADAANGLGVLLVEAHRPAEAARWFERALEASPDLVEAQLNLAIARQEAGDTKGAVDAYRRVLAARGSHAREKEAATKLLAALGSRR